MLGVCDASVGVPYDVYVISETVPHVRIYKREAAYEFNEDGTPFAKFSPPGRYQLPNGTLFPAVGVLSQTACCDGIVRYVVSYDSTTGKTSVFGIADSTNPLISISDCYPLGVRSTPTKLYLFGHVVDARDKKNIAIIFNLEHGELKRLSTIEIPGDFVELIPGTERIVTESEIIPTLWSYRMFDLKTRQESEIGPSGDRVLLCAAFNWVSSLAAR
jgi:hypothetical protein